MILKLEKEGHDFMEVFLEIRWETAAEMGSIRFPISSRYEIQIDSPQATPSLGEIPTEGPHNTNIKRSSLFLRKANF